MFTWKSLKKTFFALAPMEEVTDTSFRRVVIKAGRPEVFFTEFTACDGLFSPGREKVIHRLRYELIEQPVIAQIWGTNPDNFRKTAELVKEMGFSGVDINMGCPVPDIVKHGACSGLIRTPELASEIVRATQEGAKDLPVSVKTRVGFYEIQTTEWISHLLKHNLDALTVHFRTSKEQSKVPAHWEEAGKVVSLKNELSDETVIIGNGDVLSRQQGTELAQKYGLDGIMIGRGIFHNPWFFAEDDQRQRTIKEKFDLLVYHVTLHRDTWGSFRNYHALKRFFKIYVNGFDGAAEIREKLMATNNHQEFFELLSSLEVMDNSVIFQ